MPQLQQAKKALRASQNRRNSNDRWRKRLREATKALQKAISAGNKKEAVVALTTTTSMLDRAARRHIITQNKASRLKSRLTKTVTNLE